MQRKQQHKNSNYIPESWSTSETENRSLSIRSSDSSETCVVKGSRNFRLARSNPNKSSCGRLNPEFRTIDCVRWHVRNDETLDMQMQKAPVSFQMTLQRGTGLQGHPNSVKIQVKMTRKTCASKTYLHHMHPMNFIILTHVHIGSPFKTYRDAAIPRKWRIKTTCMT